MSEGFDPIQFSAVLGELKGQLEAIHKQNANHHAALNTRLDDFSKSLNGRIDHLEKNMERRIDDVDNRHTKRSDDVDEELSELRDEITNIKTGERKKMAVSTGSGGAAGALIALGIEIIKRALDS